MKITKKEILLFLKDLAIVAILVVVLHMSVIAPFKIDGASMCDTLNVIDGECQTGPGERVMVNVFSHKVLDNLDRGDIIVFKDNLDRYLIKRLIGMPGDEVKITKGKVFLKTKESSEFIELEEDYLNEKNQGNTILPNGQTEFTFEVPEDHFFALGDNRTNSLDSRACVNSQEPQNTEDCKFNSPDHFITKSSVKGKAFAIWWPLKNLRWVESHDYPELESREEK